MSLESNKKTVSMFSINQKLSSSHDESEIEPDIIDSDERIKLPSM